MDEKDYYTIGEAAKLCGTAASTLRYYDQINLLKPAGLNKITNYRYYTFKDLAKIRIIQNLRELNFSIGDISKMLEEDTLPNQLTVMKKKRDEIEDEIYELKKKAASINQRIENMEKELTIIQSDSASDSIISTAWQPARKILSLRKQTERANLSVYVHYFNELIELAKKEKMIPSGNLMLIHHHINVNQLFKQKEFQSMMKDLEVCMPAGQLQDSPFISEIPEGMYLSMITKGMAGKDTFIDIYSRIQKWLIENNYRAAGPLIDLLHTDMISLQPDQIAENILTEVQILIEKKD
ncbi:MerR family transcriptional regulator [Metabacillus sp. JX24]|uniref:MerR family transcriptional regulator n=1 Tax=Metabacillus sp. JX24 TaxID=3240759 RepID=UPI00350F8842